MAALPYFYYPWAISGNVSPIPLPTQISGTVSYQSGFPVGYSTALGSGGLAVPRVTFNQAMFDVTSALQQYQQIGIPNFITSPNNQGSPFPYAMWSYCIDSGVVYQSLINSNTTTPPTAGSWRIRDLDALKIIYDDVTFDSSVTQGMAVYFNGTAYFPALANGTAAQNVIGFADVTNTRVYATGSLCSVVTGLTPGSQYYLSAGTPGAISTVFSGVSVGTAYTSTLLAMNIAQNVTGHTSVIARYYVSAGTGQTFPTSTVTLVNFPVKSYDLTSAFNTGTSRFVPQVAGYYRISCGFFGQGASGNLGLRMRLNGAAWASVTANMPQQVCVSDNVFLNGSTDYIDFAVQNSGSTFISTPTDPSQIFFSAELIAN